MANHRINCVQLLPKIIDQSDLLLQVYEPIRSFLRPGKMSISHKEVIVLPLYTIEVQQSCSKHREEQQY